jgi:hypothetical protein
LHEVRLSCDPFTFPVHQAGRTQGSHVVIVIAMKVTYRNDAVNAFPLKIVDLPGVGKRQIDAQEQRQKDDFHKKPPIKSALFQTGPSSASKFVFASSPSFESSWAERMFSLKKRRKSRRCSSIQQIITLLLWGFDETTQEQPLKILLEALNEARQP